MNVMPLVNRVAALGLGVQGSTLFADVLPVETAQGILLRGPRKGTPINYELPGYYKASFEVIVRTPVADYESGLALMQQVMEALSMSNLQVENQFFNYCRPHTLPVTHHRSCGSLIEISTRFDANFLEQ